MAAVKPAAFPVETPGSPRRTPWYEITLLILLSLGIGLFLPSLKGLSIALPIGYLFIERLLRHRTWAEVGFRPAGVFPRDLLNALGWVLLVGVGTQVLAVFGTYFLLPEYSRHVVARLPFGSGVPLAAVLVSLLIATLGEELVFRAVFQRRLADSLPVPAALALSSLVFALMHYAPGPAVIVAADLGFVFVDSLIYGAIFAKTKNITVAWFAHFLADVVGLALLAAVSSLG